jgi:glutathione S-transferase
MTSKVPSLTVFGDPKVGAYSWSPFVTKLEARLRYGHLPYSRQPGSPLKSPKGKIPYVRIEEGDGKSSLISDSTLIARTLIKSGAIEDLNADLSPSQAAQDLAIRALIEDKLYFLTVRTKSKHPCEIS